MKYLRKIFKIVYISLFIFLIIFCVYLLFIELFIYKIIELPFPFQSLNHYENRTDLLAFINIIVSTGLSFAIFLLSKRVNNQSDKEHIKNRYESICIIYDYLNDIIVYVKKIVFKEREDYRKIQYNNDFLKAVYNLNNDLFNQEDIELLRDIDRSIKDFLNEEDKSPNHILSIKWVYKLIFDLNIPIDEIEKMNNIVDDDIILNNQLVMILSKLKKELKYDYKKEITYRKIKLVINNNVVEKIYDNLYYSVNGEGFLRIYEPVFFNSYNNMLFQNGGLLYEGYVFKYKMSGKGIYYYYCEKDKKHLDSSTLIEKNAKKITKILLEKNVKMKNDFQVVGKFSNGVINSGVIKSKNKKRSRLYI